MLSVANFCTDSVLSAVPKSVDGATQAFTTLIKPCVGFPQLRTVLFYFILFYFFPELMCVFQVLHVKKVHWRWCEGDGDR